MFRIGKFIKMHPFVQRLSDIDDPPISLFNLFAFGKKCGTDSLRSENGFTWRKTKLNSVALVRTRTVGEVSANFCG